MNKKHNINWNNVDWAKKNWQIAAALGIPQNTVSYYRQRYNTRKDARASYRIKWEGTDWNKRDTVIAAENLVTPASVSLARLKHAPEGLKRSPGSRATGIRTGVRFKRVTATETADSKTTTLTVSPAPASVPEPVKAQPGFVKRVLIKLRDWLFNLCVSVEKEAGK